MFITPFTLTQRTDVICIMYVYIYYISFTYKCYLCRGGGGSSALPVLLCMGICFFFFGGWGGDVQITLVFCYSVGIALCMGICFVVPVLFFGGGVGCSDYISILWVYKLACLVKLYKFY